MKIIPSLKVLNVVGAIAMMIATIVIANRTATPEREARRIEQRTTWVSR